MLKVSAAFDAGAIEVVSVPADAPAASGPVALALNIRCDATADPACRFRQWFHFRLQGARERACTIELVNAAACTYPRGWTDYRAVASYDRIDWFRVPTRFDGRVLTIEHTPARDSVYYAYFEPYSFERHLALLGMADGSPLARVSDLGNTVDGRDLNLVTVGAPGAGKRPIWIIARQHPGETMAEWFVEGMLERLLDPADPVARRLLAGSVWYVVPNMNPDGSVRGNLRANAAGANLNREWVAPSLERSPEVWRVRERMLTTGVAAFLDVHGDEALPYVFVAGSEMLPGFDDAKRAVQEHFCADFKAASPDFQTEHGYAAGKYEADALKLASKFVGHTFGCLSLTLEMPFKDNANLPDDRCGWNGARSKRLGAAVLPPLLRTLSA
jgi:murein tripeptide amidase MpaA